MKTNFNVGDYICPKTDPNKVYKITGITSLAPLQTEQDSINAQIEGNGERKIFQISEIQLSDIGNVDQPIFLDL